MPGQNDFGNLRDARVVGGDVVVEELAAVGDAFFQFRNAFLEREEIHLILSDVRLGKEQTGIHLAQAAKERGVPTLFATGHPYEGASEIAVGLLLKPYTERQLCKAIETVDRHIQGEKVKPPKGLELFIIVDERE